MLRPLGEKRHTEREQAVVYIYIGGVGGGGAVRPSKGDEHHFKTLKVQRGMGEKKLNIMTPSSCRRRERYVL